jgi:Ca2+-binding EF-hand superfamily protein
MSTATNSAELGHGRKTFKHLRCKSSLENCPYGSTSQLLWYTLSREDRTLIPPDFDFVAAGMFGIIKPHMLHFFEHSCAAIAKRVAKRCKVSAGGRAATKDDNFSDSSDNGIDTSNTDEDYFNTLLKMNAGSNFAHLAGIVNTHNFSLKDRQLDTLLGKDMPTSIRKVLIRELMRLVDSLWESFGQVLLAKYQSYETAFNALDDDKSGSIDWEEFLHAYQDLNLEVRVKGGSGAYDGAAGQRRRSESDDADNNSIYDSESVVSANTEQFRLRAATESERDLICKDSLAINLAILAAEARFMFDMMRVVDSRHHHRPVQRLASKASLSEEVTVSMQALCMRLAGVGAKFMESVRASIMRKYGRLEDAFDEFGKTENDELTASEFQSLLAALSSSVLTSQANRIFNGIDIDGSGAIGVPEMRQALSPFGSSTSFSSFRRCLLLQYGSLDVFFAQYPPQVCMRPEIIDCIAFDLQVTSVDAASFLLKLSFNDADEKKRLKQSGGEQKPDGQSTQLAAKVRSIITNTRCSWWSS